MLLSTENFGVLLVLVVLMVEDVSIIGVDVFCLSCDTPALLLLAWVRGVQEGVKLSMTELINIFFMESSLEVLELECLSSSLVIKSRRFRGGPGCKIESYNI